MAYLAQDERVQKQLRSFRLTTADSRESKRDDSKRNPGDAKKKRSLLISRSDASFTVNDVVSQIVPISSECLDGGGKVEQERPCQARRPVAVDIEGN